MFWWRTTVRRYASYEEEKSRPKTSSEAAICKEYYEFSTLYQPVWYLARTLLLDDSTSSHKLLTTTHPSSAGPRTPRAIWLTNNAYLHLPLLPFWQTVFACRRKEKNFRKVSRCKANRALLIDGDTNWAHPLNWWCYWIYVQHPSSYICIVFLVRTWLISAKSCRLSKLWPEPHVYLSAFLSHASHPLRKSLKYPSEHVRRTAQEETSGTPLILSGNDSYCDMKKESPTRLALRTNLGWASSRYMRKVDFPFLITLQVDHFFTVGQGSRHSSVMYSRAWPLSCNIWRNVVYYVKKPCMIYIFKWLEHISNGDKPSLCSLPANQDLQMSWYLFWNWNQMIHYSKLQLFQFLLAFLDFYFWPAITCLPSRQIGYPCSAQALPIRRMLTLNAVEPFYVSREGCRMRYLMNLPTKIIFLMSLEINKW